MTTTNLQISQKISGITSIISRNLQQMQQMHKERQEECKKSGINKSVKITDSMEISNHKMKRTHQNTNEIHRVRKKWNQ